MSSSTLSVNDKSVELPVMEGTIGPSVIDISKLYGQTGMFTYDPGFTSTAATESKITYIDGDQGILLYRGYPIDQLAEHVRVPRDVQIRVLGVRLGQVVAQAADDDTHARRPAAPAPGADGCPGDGHHVTGLRM